MRSNNIDLGGVRVIALGGAPHLDLQILNAHGQADVAEDVRDLAQRSPLQHVLCGEGQPERPFQEVIHLLPALCFASIRIHQLVWDLPEACATLAG